MDTREVGSSSLQVQVITLSSTNPSEQIFGPDDQRRGAVVYVDPEAVAPAYLADSQNHANAEVGAPMTPGAFPSGFELGCNGSAFVYAARADLDQGVAINVYAVIESGQSPDANAKASNNPGGLQGLRQALSPNV